MVVVLGIFFGLAYNHAYYPHRLIEYLEAASVGFFCGLLIGSLEEFKLREILTRIAFLQALIVRTILYSIIISLILTAVLSIEISMEMEISYIETFTIYLTGPDFQRDLVFSLLMVSAILFIVQIIQLFGLSNFTRLIIGTYHRPKEVSRIFLFVDLKDSTSIAEKLNNEKYSNFIKDYFYYISDAITLYGGEVYQYVGDEIVVTWPAKANDSRSIMCFFEMKKIIYQNQNYFEKKYGLIPDFKAGLHYGKVIVTEVGKIKKEIVYHGDVINTASRIEGKCNELDQTLLASSPVIEFIAPQNDFQVLKKGNIYLKGKSDELALFGVMPISSSLY